MPAQCGSEDVCRYSGTYSIEVVTEIELFACYRGPGLYFCGCPMGQEILIAWYGLIRHCLI